MKTPRGGLTVSLRHHRRWDRPRLRFTRDGKYFVALTLGIGFAAINTGNNLLYLVLGVMLAMIICSGILSELTLRGLQATRQQPERTFANHPFIIGIALRNGKSHLPSFSLQVDDVWQESAKSTGCFFLKIPAQSKQLAYYRHTVGMRGRHVLERTRIATRFPFALFEKSRLIACRSELIVYPEVQPASGVLPDTLVRGDQHQRRAGRWGEFTALRNYRDGDDPRDIFWRKSARVGRTLVREHEDPHSRELTIFLDNRRKIAPPTAELVAAEEQTVSRAASMAMHYLERGYTVALMSHTASVRAEAGSTQIDRILHALALIEFVLPDRPNDAPQLPHNYVHISPHVPIVPQPGSADTAAELTASDSG